MKTCTLCKKELSHDNFYKDKRGRDGLYSKCKGCHNLKSDETKMKRYYSDDVFRKKVLDRATGRSRTPMGREYYRRKYAEDDRYRERQLAKGAVGRAITKGFLVKGPCFICGCTEDVHAHHKDYRKKLSVEWLCRGCHNEWHRNNSPVYDSAEGVGN